MAAPQSVGIVGVDYSGSTILTAMVDTLPGVLGAGETHWIIDRGAGCRECGTEPCPVFTTAVIEGLRTDREDWWGKLAAAGDARVVVSSDKRPSHYRTLGFPDALIYVHKDPVAHIASRLRRMETAGPAAIAEATDWYVRHSINRLTWTGNFGHRVVAVALEAVVAEPAATMRGLSSYLGVEFSPSSIRFWEYPHHYIGGNFSVKGAAAAGAFDRGLRIKDNWHEVLSSELAASLVADEGVRRVTEMISRLPTIG